MTLGVCLTDKRVVRPSAIAELLVRGLKSITHNTCVLTATVNSQRWPSTVVNGHSEKTENALMNRNVHARTTCDSVTVSDRVDLTYLARSANLPIGLCILPSVISSFFYYEQSHLSIYWTDFHDLYTKWKVL